MTYDEFISAALALCAARGIDLKDVDNNVPANEVIRLLVPGLVEHPTDEDAVDILRRALRGAAGDDGWGGYPERARWVLEKYHDIR